MVLTHERKGDIMDIDFDIEPPSWSEDLGGLSFDELRDLPYAIQAGLDVAVFE